MNYSIVKQITGIICIILLTSCNQTLNKKKAGEVSDNDLTSSGITNNLGSPPGQYFAEKEKNEYIIPFEFYGMNLMVDARMNNMKIKMLIDNGVMWDELLFYGGAIVDSLEIEVEGDILVTGAGEGDGMDSKTASNLSIAFGEVLFKDQNAVITTKESGFSDFFPGVAGQVCGAFFKHFVVEFNFDENNMILHKKETYKYKGNGKSLKMTRDTAGSYSIPINLKFKNKESINHQISIDLGGIDHIALPISSVHGFDKPNSEKIYLGHGASGEINGYLGEIELLNIAGYSFSEVPTIFVESDNVSDHTNTTIGLPLLMKFNLVFDYFNETLYLAPNSHFNESFEIIQNNE
jgi:hypothetical protein